MRYFYRATAIDGISINETHANAFSTSCLDYIPGSAIMGALAGQLYASADVDGSILNRLFQTNSVMFSNAYPIVDGNKVSLPTPMCLHYPKDAKLKVDDALDRSILVNKCKEDPQDSKIQFKQIRSAFVDAQLSDLYSVPCRFITRTAIDPLRQTAKDKTLHVQEYIQEGSSFCGFIALDDELSSKLGSKIEAFLNKCIRVGNSRNSEFGRLQLEFLPQFDLSLNKPKSFGNELYLWCISDCEFINEDSGLSSSVPVLSNLWEFPELIGEGCGYVPEKSFVRNITLRHFNRKRGGLDSENLLVKKGSVICFKIKQPLSEEQLLRLQNSGIGLNRQYGYGQVIVNPAWIKDNRAMADVKQLFESATVPSATTLKEATVGSLNPNLKGWLKLAKEYYGNLHNDHMFIKFLVQLYQEMRKYLGTLDTEFKGPSKTQWQEICEILKDIKEKHGGISEVSVGLDQIKEYLSNGAGKINNDWAIPFQYGNEHYPIRFDCFANFVIDYFNLDLNRTKSVDYFIKQFEILTKKDLRSVKNLDDLAKQYQKEESNE